MEWAIPLDKNYDVIRKAMYPLFDMINKRAQVSAEREDLCAYTDPPNTRVDLHFAMAKQVSGSIVKRLGLIGR